MTWTWEKFGLLVEFIMVVADVTTDIVVCYYLILEGNYQLAATSIGLIVMPLLLYTYMKLYSMTDRPENVCFCMFN